MDDLQLDMVDLKSLYEQAVVLFVDLSCHYTEAKYEECIELLCKCQRRIESLCLFSWNETLEDLESSSLQ